MSQESDHGEAVSVSAGGVTVEKTFAADEFPVPAVKFVVRSERDDHVDVRLSDDIPESFSMERVGFHPDYESANWTAYEDQLVEYERSLEPHEEVLTVYGVRVDDGDDISAFLTDPTLETIVPGDDSVEEVVGADSSRPVRTALADDATALPGLDGDDPLSADSEDVSSESSDDVSEPLELEDPLADDPLVETSDAVPEEASPQADDASTEEPTDDEAEPIALEDPFADPDEVGVETDALDSESGDAVDESPVGGGDDPQKLDAPDVPDAPSAGELSPVPRSLSTDLTAAVVARPSDADPLGEQFDHESTTSVAVDADSETESEVGPHSDAVEAAVPSPRSETGVAGALADEIRSGDVDEDDLELLREELDLGLPRSVDVRIRRLQSQMDDLEAYSDALATFLDENGTAEELVSGLRTELDTLSATADRLESELDVLREERDDLDSAVENVDGRVDRVSSRLDGVDESVIAVADDVESLDDEMGEVRGDLAELDARIVSVEELGADERAELKAELDAIEEELEELDAFRDRLSSVFGGEQ
ncbi:hypothetical protein [Haloprofundus halobius]|uniref:hypothetical protein n=1 Tax=Haloprofundus halobius TaxID=2876194 RepID=UPI001CCCD75F|nr:hypothetical protein [Haloprofundus halobius]